MDEQFKLDPDDFEGYGDEMANLVDHVNRQAQDDCETFIAQLQNPKAG